jgi:hypothetical protein
LFCYRNKGIAFGESPVRSSENKIVNVEAALLILVDYKRLLFNCREITRDGAIGLQPAIGQRGQVALSATEAYSISESIYQVITFNRTAIFSQ